MTEPQKSKEKEEYSASLSGSVSEGHSTLVSDQTSILGSNSVSIYTEGNTHVAGAIIAALNDNLKLDTGTLTYENLVGKTTQSSTTAGIDWKYSPEQKKDKGNTGNDNAQGGGSKGENLDSQSTQHGEATPQTTPQKSEEQKRAEATEKALDEKYKNVPGWMASIFRTEEKPKYGGAIPKKTLCSHLANLLTAIRKALRPPMPLLVRARSLCAIILANLSTA